MGERRLARLSESFDVAVERSFLEIHPETPPDGRPIASLGYPPERWRQMMANIARMGEEAGIAFAERTFTANSHKALLLAEAVRQFPDGMFSSLNERLFRAYFTEGRNIGDVAVLREIAEAAGVPRAAVDRAWSDPLYEELLKTQGDDASRLGITAVPTFLIAGKWMIEGAVPLEMLKKAVEDASPGT